MARKVDLRFSVSDYMQTADSPRYELVEGDLLLTPSPSYIHQQLVIRLLDLLRNYLQTSKQGGTVLIAPFDVVLSDHSVFQPDVFFVSPDRTGIITKANVQGAPDLVIEVLSLSTADRDRGLKRKAYARYGVREMWLVDPDTRTIEVAALTQAGLDTVQVYCAPLFAESILLPGFNVNVADLFAGLNALEDQS